MYPNIDKGLERKNMFNLLELTKQFLQARSLCTYLRSAKYANPFATSCAIDVNLL